jgi:LPXTG-motif cell wall-anchored protein
MGNEINRQGLTDQELVRREKVKKLRELGIDPFGQAYEVTIKSLDLKEKYKGYTNEQLEETTTVDNTTNEIVEESTNKSEESITNNSQVETAKESKDSNNIIAYIGVGIAAIAGVLFAKGKKD